MTERLRNPFGSMYSEGNLRDLDQLLSALDGSAVSPYAFVVETVSKNTGVEIQEKKDTDSLSLFQMQYHGVGIDLVLLQNQKTKLKFRPDYIPFNPAGVRRSALYELPHDLYRGIKRPDINQIINGATARLVTTDGMSSRPLSLGDSADSDMFYSLMASEGSEVESVRINVKADVFDYGILFPNCSLDLMRKAELVYPSNHQMTGGAVNYILDEGYRGDSYVIGLRSDISSRFTTAINALQARIG